MESTSGEVATFRRFSRSFTHRVGALTDRYLGQDRPLGEARLLFEIDGGASLRDLRTRLGLDAGYLSRMVHALSKQGLVRVSVHPRDSRLRMAELTPAGAAELAEQNRRADAVVGGLLAGLTSDQRAELIGALTAAERLLRLATVTIEVADPDSDDARACLAAYAAEIDERFPEGFPLADLVRPDQVRGSVGALLVAYDAGRPIGCGAVRTLEPGVAEIRHLWVHAGARGLGLSRQLLAELERQAAGRGLPVVRLGTHRTLTEAIRLYRTSGYTEIPGYDSGPHNDHWFEKRLPGSGS